MEWTELREQSVYTCTMKRGVPSQPVGDVNRSNPLDQNSRMRSGPPTGPRHHGQQHPHPPQRNQYSSRDRHDAPSPRYERSSPRVDAHRSATQTHGVAKRQGDRGYQSDSQAHALALAHRRQNGAPHQTIKRTSSESSNHEYRRGNHHTEDERSTLARARASSVPKRQSQQQLRTPRSGSQQYPTRQTAYNRDDRFVEKAGGGRGHSNHNKMAAAQSMGYQPVEATGTPSHRRDNVTPSGSQRSARNLDDSRQFRDTAETMERSSHDISSRSPRNPIVRVSPRYPHQYDVSGNTTPIVAEQSSGTSKSIHHGDGTPSARTRGDALERTLPRKDIRSFAAPRSTESSSVEKRQRDPIEKRAALSAKDPLESPTKVPARGNSTKLAVQSSDQSSKSKPVQKSSLDQATLFIGKNALQRNLNDAAVVLQDQKSDASSCSSSSSLSQEDLLGIAKRSLDLSKRVAAPQRSAPAASMYRQAQYLKPLAERHSSNAASATGGNDTDGIANRSLDLSKKAATSQKTTSDTSKFREAPYLKPLARSDNSASATGGIAKSVLDLSQKEAVSQKPAPATSKYRETPYLKHPAERRPSSNSASDKNVDDAGGIVKSTADRLSKQVAPPQKSTPAASKHRAAPYLKPLTERPSSHSASDANGDDAGGITKGALDLSTKAAPPHKNTPTASKYREAPYLKPLVERHPGNSACGTNGDDTKQQLLHSRALAGSEKFTRMVQTKSTKSGDKLSDAPSSYAYRSATLLSSQLSRNSSPTKVSLPMELTSTFSESLSLSLSRSASPDKQARNGEGSTPNSPLKSSRFVFDASRYQATDSPGKDRKQTNQVEAPRLQRYVNIDISGPPSKTTEQPKPSTHSKSVRSGFEPSRIQRYCVGDEAKKSGKPAPLETPPQPTLSPDRRKSVSPSKSTSLVFIPPRYQKTQQQQQQHNVGNKQATKPDNSPQRKYIPTQLDSPLQPKRDETLNHQPRESPIGIRRQLTPRKDVNSDEKERVPQRSNPLPALYNKAAVENSGPGTVPRAQEKSYTLRPLSSQRTPRGDGGKMRDEEPPNGPRGQSPHEDRPNRNRTPTSEQENEQPVEDDSEGNGEESHEKRVAKKSAEEYGERSRPQSVRRMVKKFDAKQCLPNNKPSFSHSREAISYNTWDEQDTELDVESPEVDNTDPSSRQTEHTKTTVPPSENATSSRGLEFLSHLLVNHQEERQARQHSVARDPRGVYGSEEVSSVVLHAEPPGSSPSERRKRALRHSSGFSGEKTHKANEVDRSELRAHDRRSSPSSRITPSRKAKIQSHRVPKKEEGKSVKERRELRQSSPDLDEPVDAPTGRSQIQSMVRITAVTSNGSGSVTSDKSEVVVKSSGVVKPLPSLASRTDGYTESSDSRPDAFRWLHQKYGNKPTTANVDAIERAKEKKLPPPNMAEAIPRRSAPFDDDEDDIFFGLDDESLPDQDAPPLLEGQDEMKDESAKVGREKSTDASKMKIQEAQGAAHHHQEHNEPNPALLERTTDGKHSGKTLHEAIFATTVISDLTASLVTDRTKRTQFFKHNDSVLKTPKTFASNPYARSVLYQQASEESTFQDQPCKNPPSVFTDISDAIVSSLQNANCTVPENVAHRVKEVPTCAMNAKAQCAARIDEALDSFAQDQDSATRESLERSGTDTTATTNVLNDVERRIWAAWDRRRSRVRETTVVKPTYEDDLLPELEQSSSSTDSETKAKHYGLRQEAQDELMHHAGKALALYDFSSVSCKEDNGVRVAHSDASSSEMPKPKSAAMAKKKSPSPTSRLSSVLSFEEQELLEKFSSALKNTGIEVLKLGRRNVWQIRYLTVSREVTRLPSGSVAGEIGQCPKALLWTKQFKPQNCSVSCIKENGRGGVLFEHLRRIRPTSSNEHYDNHLPKKLKQIFPEFAGVALDYAHAGGDRQLHLCFKSPQESQAFITAMLIIREANERGSPPTAKDEASAYTTHSNSDSLLD